MKKLRMLSFLLVAILMASCSDDDNETINVATQAVGSYSGYTVASCNYFANQVANNQTVSVALASQGKVNVNLESDTWGSFTIADATVSESNNTLVVTGSGVTKMGMGDTKKEYSCNLAGTIANGVAELDFTCPQVMGVLTVSFRQGDVPASIVVPGTYAGYTKADCTYFQGMYADAQTLTIEASGNDKYKATYTSETWGEFTVENITTVAEDGKFILSGEGSTMMGMGGNVAEYACSFTGSVDVEKETPTFKFTVPAVMGGLTIEFNTGDMPQE